MHEKYQFRNTTIDILLYVIFEESINSNLNVGFQVFQNFIMINNTLASTDFI